MTERRRLGYGGGFYDQFLQNACSAVKIAVCFNCQVLPELPEEKRHARPYSDEEDGFRSAGKAEGEGNVWI
ncbi:MAG: 5-formyltetrahydrofolate cyclo-ligase [Eisenbergiella sp.]